ncbi:MAG: ROK family protein [Chloroflexia bacterium]
MLGRAIASAAALLDIDLFVLGGGVTLSGPLLFGPLGRARRVRAHLSFVRDIRVIPAQLGQESGVVGRRRWRWISPGGRGGGRLKPRLAGLRATKSACAD